VDTFTGVELLTFSDGGQLTAGGDVTGFAALSLSSGLTVVAGSIGDEAVTFNAPASTLQVHGLQGATTVSGFQAGDAIDLVGITGATLTTNASGTTVTSAGGSTLDLGTAPTGSVFKLYGDAHGGTNVLLDPPLRRMRLNTRTRSPTRPARLRMTATPARSTTCNVNTSCPPPTARRCGPTRRTYS